jgi:hypothetical protein
MKIFVNGLQRTGTNYLRQILQESTSLEVTDAVINYHKHHVNNGNDVLVDQIFTTIKNPYHWAESICFRHRADIVKFYPHIINYEDNKMLAGINLRLLMGVYKDYYTSWLDAGAILIRYEDLLLDKYVEEFLLAHFSDYYIKLSIPKFVDWSGEIDQTRKNNYIQNILTHLEQHHINIINETLNDYSSTLRGFKHLLGRYSC